MASYVYTKERRKFGIQCIFVEESKRIFNLPTDHEILDHHVARNTIDANTQKAAEYALIEVNTSDKTFRSNGMNHTEGGWPKDINILDEEQTMRYKKRLEREDKYDTSLKKLCEPMTRTICENNAVNIFQKYFPDGDGQDVNCVDFSMNVIRQFNCPASKNVVANRIHFNPKLSDEMVVSISHADFPHSTDEILESYVWKIELSNQPLLVLNSDSVLVQLEYNSKDSFIIAGGRFNGTVCLYDTRAGGDIQERSVREYSHKDAINSLLWSQSKQNTEFFTGSSDGHVMWWDTRKMTEPYENYTCDLVIDENPDKKMKLGCSVLEFTYSMPSRFMLGTDNGFIFGGNKRGMSQAERFSTTKECFNGKVYSLARNPFAEKNYVAVGDHCFKIWSDDCRDNEIICNKQTSVPLTCGAWSLKRGSLLFIGKANGSIELWDLLINQTEPIAIRESNPSRVHHICPHPDGLLIAVAYANGKVNMFKLSESLSASHRNERTMLTDLCDRETNREKNFHNKVKELKLQDGGLSSEHLEQQDSSEDIQPDVDYIKECYDVFIDICEKNKSDN